jgi:ferrochelatase
LNCLKRNTQLRSNPGWGEAPWIRPYTDELYRELPKRGVKRLAVVCPAFVADCLETLEEVQIRGKEEFIRSGGEDLILVPSLNSTPGWVESLVQMLQKHSRILPLPSKEA